MGAKCIPDDIEHRRSTDDLTKMTPMENRSSMTKFLFTVQLENFHSLVIVTSSDEFHASFFEFIDVYRIDFITMAMAFIDDIHVPVELF